MEFWKRKKSERIKPLVFEESIASNRYATHLPEVVPDRAESAEKFLQTINYSALNEIFDEISRKSGVPTSKDDTELYLDSNKIRINSDQEEKITNDDEMFVVGGVFIPAEGVIKLNWSALSNNNGLPTPQALKTLIHEAVHMRAFNESKILEETEHGFIEQVRGGLQETISIKQNEGHKTETFAVKRIGVSLNEAVTEKIAIEVYQEYMRRTGHALSSTKESEAGSENLTLTYAADRLFLQMFLTEVSLCTEIEEDMVWQSIVRTYMNGSAGPQELFEEVEAGLMDNPGIKQALLAESDTPPSILGIISKINDDAKKEVHRVLNALSPEYITSRLHLN